MYPSTSEAASSTWPSSGTEPSSTLSAVPVYETVAPASDDPNYVAWGPDYSGTPEAIRGSLGSTVIGPQNVPLDLENPDLLAPPTTDNGEVYVHLFGCFSVPRRCLRYSMLAARTPSGRSA